MWIATNRGFLSIVAATTDALPTEVRSTAPPGTRFLCVRARNADHLRDLFPGRPLYEWPGRDYPARVFVRPDDVADLIGGLIRTIAYDNFKGSVRDAALHDAYMQVWHVMHRYGFNRGRPVGTFYEPAVPYGQLTVCDDEPFLPDEEDDDQRCTTPGCSDLNPCLDCIIEATEKAEREREAGGDQPD